MRNGTEKEPNHEKKNYMTAGIVFGMLAGVVVMSILSMYGQILWGGVCIGVGMLIGMLVGMNIPKKD
ncbi:MAG: hypothetical protein Q4D65_06105 [Peptostreptococcaceae bacterium]|nr:hypothetical protein [Peptostreptococcaceae bacterium]